MRYEKQGLDHFSYVEIVTDDYIVISETNYKKGEFTYRFLPLDYPHILGYYVPIGATLSKWQATSQS